MDYSKLVEAIRENNQERSSDIINQLRPVLVSFLVVRYHASHQDAEDCTQNTLLIALEKIRDDKLLKPESIVSYIFTTLRREFLKKVGRNKEYTYETMPVVRYQAPDQLNRLLSKERNEILRKCVEELSPDHQTYITYWFNNPDHDAGSVADKFNISVSNAWTKKHRIIKLLNDCISKKL